MSTDAADSERIAEALVRLAPALARFNEFEGPDPTISRRPEWQALLEAPLPRHGDGLDEVVRQLEEVLIPSGLRLGAPGFCGWVTGQPTTSGVAALLAQTVAGPQRFFVHPFNELERVGLSWLKALLGVAPDASGVFTSGGSAANLIGLGAARQRAFERKGVDPAADGVSVGRWRTYASGEAHHVVARSAAVLGLGRNHVAAVGCDEAQRIDLDALARMLDADERAGVAPVALVATAGTVNSGAIDPLPELVEIAEERDLWLHVDGAYGLFGRLDARLASLFEGLERADSVVVDPHKWMATPVGCGAVFVRDGALLERAFTLEPAAYLEGAVGEEHAPMGSPWDSFAGNHHHLSIEQSAPPRGVQVWAILREIGAEGLRSRVSRHLELARRLADHARRDRHLELLAEPTLSICCFRYRADTRTETELDALNHALVQRLHAETRFVPSTTRVGGRLAIRPCYINPRTSEADVDELVQTVLALGDDLTQAARSER